MKTTLSRPPFCGRNTGSRTEQPPLSDLNLSRPRPAGRLSRFPGAAGTEGGGRGTRGSRAELCPPPPRREGGGHVSRGGLLRGSRRGRGRPCPPAPAVGSAPAVSVQRPQAGRASRRREHPSKVAVGSVGAPLAVPRRLCARRAPRVARALSQRNQSSVGHAARPHSRPPSGSRERQSKVPAGAGVRQPRTRTLVLPHCVSGRGRNVPEAQGCQG